MLQRVSKTLLSRNGFRLLSNYPTELISVNDPVMFPPEPQSVIKRSQYGHDLTMTKCTVDQLAWKNVTQWEDKVAIVSFKMATNIERCWK